MYKCKYFAPHELVPPEVYNGFQNKDDIYGLFEDNFLRCIDLVREWTGVPLTMNNWKSGGSRRDSGYRAQDSSFGASKSAHKPDLPARKACAGDMVSPKMTTAQMWDIINQRASELPCKIRIERTSGGKPITWLHLDTNAAPGQLVQVYYFNA